MTKTKDSTYSFLNDYEECIRKVSAQKDIIVKIINQLLKARDNGKKIYTMGNGGSGSTASHFVSDLLKTAIIKHNKRFAAISLVDNIPVTSAWSNDVSYDEIFVEQLRNFLCKGDVVIGFSGSGSSKNIIKAMRYAKDNSAYCIGFTGMSGGSLPKICDVCFLVPSDDMLIIESVHLMLCHCIITAIRTMGKPLFRYE